MTDKDTEQVKSRKLTEAWITFKTQYVLRIRLMHNVAERMGAMVAPQAHDVLSRYFVKAWLAYELGDIHGIESANAILATIIGDFGKKLSS